MTYETRIVLRQARYLLDQSGVEPRPQWLSYWIRGITTMQQLVELAGWRSGLKKWEGALAWSYAARWVSENGCSDWWPWAFPGRNGDGHLNSMGDREVAKMRENAILILDKILDETPQGELQL